MTGLRVTGLGVIGLVLLGGCDSSPEPIGSPPERSASEVVSQADHGTLPAGQAHLLVDEGGLTLLANSAPRRPLLESLSRELGFELVMSDVGSEPVSAHIERGHLRDVLPYLLPDRAYRVDYRLSNRLSNQPSTQASNQLSDQHSGGRAMIAHEVARLVIAPLGKPAVAESIGGGRTNAASGETATVEQAATAASPADSATSKSRAVPSAKPINWEEIAALLDDADAEERIEALRRLEPEGKGEALIKDRLAHDPDARVRLVAAQQFEFAETLTAVDALLEALNDPDKAVVLAAIDGLEFSDDVTVVEDLARMRPHPDSEIDEALEDAIDFIVDED